MITHERIENQTPRNVRVFYFLGAPLLFLYSTLAILMRVRVIVQLRHATDDTPADYEVAAAAQAHALDLSRVIMAVDADIHQGNAITEDGSMLLSAQGVRYVSNIATQLRIALPKVGHENQIIPRYEPDSGAQKESK